jgi:protein-tyrosine phosphatase
VTLGLVNATNARDLGGIATSDGRRVRSGLLFRSGALNRLTEADLDVVAKLGLSCVVDLRSEREVDMVGADRLPNPPPGELIALPLSDPDNMAFSGVTSLIKGDPSPEVPLDRDLLVDEMLRVYRWLAVSEPARAAVGRVLRMITDPAMLPLLFHCTAGKDRTGWLAAVLLTALGVEREVVAADYLRSTELSQGSIAFVVGRLARQVSDPTAALPMLEARPEYLAEAFATAEARYGDMATYVREGLAVTDETLAVLRANLLE